MIDRRGRAARRHAALQVGREPGPDRDREPDARERSLRVPLRLPRVQGRGARVDSVPAQLGRLPLRHGDPRPAALDRADDRRDPGPDVLRRRDLARERDDYAVELPQGRVEGSPRPGRALLRAEVRLRRLRRRAATGSSRRQHAPSPDPLRDVAERLAGRRPRLEPRRAQRAARRRRSRTSPRWTSSARPTQATPRRSRSTSTATSTWTLGQPALRLRARARRDRASRAPRGGRAQDRRDPEARRDALREHRQHRVSRRCG